MSAPIQITALLSLTEAGVSVQLGSSGLYVPITGSKYIQAVMSVPTTAAGTAIPVTGLANLGYALFMNLDATNYIEILVATGPGAAIIKLLPGDVALFRCDPALTAPAALAHTGACLMEYLILEN